MPLNGKWEILNELAGALAMHAALLSTGQVLYFGGNERRKEQHVAGPSGWDHTRIWTPDNGHVDFTNYQTAMRRALLSIKGGVN